MYFKFLRRLFGEGYGTHIMSSSLSLWGQVMTAVSMARLRNLLKFSSGRIGCPYNVDDVQVQPVAPIARALMGCVRGLQSQAIVHIGFHTHVPSDYNICNTLYLPRPMVPLINIS